MKKFIFIVMLAAYALAGAQTSPVNNPSRSGASNITGGTIDGTPIGGTTPAAGAFTTLSASGAVTLNPANAAVSLAPTGTGTVTINPATAGTINKMSIGATTPASGAFTIVNMNGATTTGLSAGEIGFTNGAALRWRNNANDAYRNVLYLDSSDNLQLGGGGATNNTVIAVAGAGTIATFSTTGVAITGNVKASTTLSTGAATLTLTTGAVGLSKMTASASAPGAGGAKLELVCGTNAGTAKLVISAGTSATTITITDNIGAGVTGC